MNEKNKHPLDWNAKLVKYFFENGRLVWLIILILIFGGITSLLSFKREGFPAVNIKTANIQTLYPGASSLEVESKVTKEIESAIKEIKGVKDFSSVSQNSFSYVSVNFDESVNIDSATQDIQNKISTIKGNLPKEAEQPKISTFNGSGPTFVYAVTSDTSIEEINKNSKNVIDELESLPEIKKASFNDIKENVYIELRIKDLENNGIPLATVSQILQANNVTLPVGIAEIDGKNQSITSYGSFKSVSDIENLIVGFNPNTYSIVYLKDVADVSKNNEKDTVINRFGYLKDGNLITQNTKLISIEITNSADIIKTKEIIAKHFDEAQKEGKINKDLVLLPVYDQAEQTKEQINEILDASIGSRNNWYLLGGLQLLFIAMLLLVNWRAALVSVLAIPFSFAFTFISLKLTGADLNTIVLFSLVLVLGLIVDPAIVMIEAIQRYRDLKYKDKEAVVESGRRYGASLFMAVLTSLLVFIPFGVVSGYFGEIIKYIPLTVVPALLASYFVPIAILPYLTKKTLKSYKHDELANKFGEDENLSKFAKFIMNVNTWILEKRWRQLIILFASIILIVLSITLVTSGKIQVVQFAKPSDNMMLQIKATYNKGLTLSEKDKNASEVEKLLIREKSIKDYFYLDQSQNFFWMFINLKDKNDRKEASEKSVEIVKRIKADIGSIAGFTDITVDEVMTGPPSGDYQINVQLATNNLEKLESAAKNVGEYLKKLPHVVKVDDGFSTKTEKEIQIKLNLEKVQKANLSSIEVGTQLKSLIDQTKIGKLEESDGQSFDIYMETSEDVKNINDIKNLPLLTRDSQIIKVEDVADVTDGTNIGAIERYNGLRFVSIKARVDETKNVAEVQKSLDKYLSKSKLKSLGIDSKLNQGDIGDLTKSFTELGIALLIAIILTYVFLVLQFKSFSLPGIMLFTIPLSLIGVFPALYLFNIQFGFLELLGITILVGIVENVAIFLIDYAGQLIKEKNLTPKEAIIQSSGVRFRPILLTKLVALGGLLPLAIESEFWRGLSIVIIAGIGLSGFFSLVTIPILYIFIMKVRQRIHRKKK